MTVEVLFDDAVARWGTGTGFATSFFTAVGFTVAFARASCAWVGSVSRLMVRLRVGAPASGFTGREVVVEVLAVFVVEEEAKTFGFTEDSVLLRTSGLVVTFAFVVEDGTGALDACDVVGAVVERLGPGRLAGLLVLVSVLSLFNKEGSGKRTLLAPPITLGLAAAVGSCISECGTRVGPGTGLMGP